MTLNHAIILKSRPKARPSLDDFAAVDLAVPDLGPGEVLARTLFLSLDPYMFGRIKGTSGYAGSVEIGGVITGESVAQIVASQAPGLKPGDIVVGTRGWQTLNVCPADGLVKLDPAAAPVSTYLGVLGMPGTTAYSGLKDIGEPKAGETLVVSAASGAVGSVAGQIGKRAGCYVVGVAGGPEKCRFVVETLGFDACIDHRAPDFAAQLAAACPRGIDIYFENVGGPVQAAAFNLLNLFGRVIMCGAIANYGEAALPPGPNLMFTVWKRVRIQGLIVSDKPERFAEWRALAAPWVKDGSLKYKEDIVDGLDNAPAALLGFLDGRNFGKVLIHVADPV